MSGSSIVNGAYISSKLLGVIRPDIIILSLITFDSLIALLVQPADGFFNLTASSKTMQSMPAVSNPKS